MELREVYLGESGLLTGSGRVNQEAKDASAAILAGQEIERKQLLMQRKRMMLDAQIAALQLDLETDVQESQQIIAQEKLKIVKWERDRGEMAKSRFADKVVPERVNGAPSRGVRKMKRTMNIRARESGPTAPQIRKRRTTV